MVSSLGPTIGMINAGHKLIDFYSLNWEEQFPDIVQRRLPRLLSDHFPLMLDCGVSTRSGGNFKFEKTWLKFEGFVDQVRLW